MLTAGILHRGLPKLWLHSVSLMMHNNDAQCVAPFIREGPMATLSEVLRSEPEDLREGPGPSQLITKFVRLSDIFV